MRRIPHLLKYDERLPAVREGAPLYVGGKPVFRDPVRYVLVAHVQPLSGDELLQLPEGDRTREQFALYTANEEQPVALGDLVWRAGKVYEVQALEPWGSYSKARMALRDAGPDKVAEFDSGQGA